MIKNRWPADESAPSDAPSTPTDQVQHAANQLAPIQRNHPYLSDLGLNGALGHVYVGTEEIAGVQCHGSAAFSVLDFEQRPVNVILIVKNDAGVYEDLLMPGGQLNDCCGYIGIPTAPTLIVEEYASGLALNAATGLGIIVALHTANVEAVATAFKRKHPDIPVCICANGFEVGHQNHNLAVAHKAAETIGATVAVPATAQTFLELHRTGGPKAVCLAVDSARVPSTLSTARVGRDEPGPPPEPNHWPNPVHPQGVAAALMITLARFVALPFERLLTIVLWTAFTFVIDLMEFAPILFLRSALKRSGKTTVLSILCHLVYKPMPTSNITPAALFRAVNIWSPTLLIDEADMSPLDKEMTGIIDAGHRRELGFVTRIGFGNQPERFRCYCPKAIAAIGALPHQIMDRSILVGLMRKRPDESVEKYRPSKENPFIPLRALLARWISDNRHLIDAANPKLPPLLNDRAADNWEPLLKIAECWGPIWFVHACKAAINLTAQHRESACSSEELLLDIREIFQSTNVAKIRTSVLVNDLCADPEKPWATYHRGRSLTANDLSTLLREFEIESKNIRFSEGVFKGYELDQLSDAFARYLPE